MDDLTHATLCLLVNGSPPKQVLLGRKKVGFGAGKVTGFGGKVEPGETVAHAAAREMAEETGVVVQIADLHPAAHLSFHFPARPEWSMAVDVFLAWRWAGTPLDGREMTPQWFAVNSLPLGQMWADGAHWLPRVLAGEKIDGDFTFNSDNETLRTVKIRLWDPALDGEAA